jgi:5'-3' exonuclease
MSSLYLVDASIYIFRAYFSLPESITNRNGHPANAVYGYASFLAGLFADAKPTHIAAMFDESLDTCFRNEIHTQYKSNRTPPDDDLARQLNWCKELTSLVGVKTYASDRYEADDLIGTAARHMRTHGFTMTYVTGDKDIGQLVTGRDRVWDFARNEYYNHRAIRERFGVQPNQLADYLALAGDPVDVIPGVPGIGGKTAAALIQQFGSLEKLYRHLQIKHLRDATALSIRGLERIDNKLREHEQLAWMSRELATISDSAGIRPTPTTLKRLPVKKRALQDWLNRNGFGDRLGSRLGL